MRLSAGISPPRSDRVMCPAGRRARSSCSRWNEGCFRLRLRQPASSSADALHRLPGTFGHRRQGIHMFEEECELPNLRFVERMSEGRHAGKPNAVRDLPKRDALRIVFDAVLGKLRRTLIETGSNV